MRLLVSVSTAEEAETAVAGGADIIDAKNPASGALGPVTHDEFARIVAAVGGQRPVTAALGDADDDDRIHEAARAFTKAGASLVKVGFAGVPNITRVEQLLAATVHGADGGGAIAVAYADADPTHELTPAALVAIAARAGARGVLLDTLDKSGAGVRRLMTDRALRAWIAGAHDLGLTAAVAGKLTIADVPVVRETGADIAGVRGAACDGGRSGRVSLERVRSLRRAMAGDDHRAAASGASNDR